MLLVVAHSFVVRMTFPAVHQVMVAALVFGSLKLHWFSDEITVGVLLVFQVEECDLVPCGFCNEHIECFTALAERRGRV